MILASFFAALGQLTDARFRGVLLTGVGLTLALLIAFSVAFVWFIGWAVGDAVTLPLIGEVTWVNDIASWGGALVVIVLSTFLMVPVASGVTSMFLDQVAQAVEDEHYPQLGPALPVPFLDALKDSIGFLAVLIGANLLALVLYIMFATFAPLIFWGLNGFLLGREYFTLAAMRRIGPCCCSSPHGSSRATDTRSIGSAIPTRATDAEETPTRNISLRSVSRPISNSRIATPTSARRWMIS